MNAKTATKDTAPATVTPAPIKVGNFVFKIAAASVIPEPAQRRNPNAMFFGEAFDQLPHHGGFFVPVTFWTAPHDEGGRGIAADKVNVSYQKGKIRDQFKTWQTKDKEGRKDHELSLVTRNKGDLTGFGDEKAPEDGISVFMIYPENLRPKK